MENKQLSHLEFKEVQKHFNSNVILVLENLEHSQNIGSAFRVADAFNVEEVIIVNNNPIMQNKIKSTARSSEKFVNHQVVSSTQEALSIAKSKNYAAFALEITSTSKPLREFNFADYSGVAIIVGNERLGVDKQTLLQVDHSTHIDMFGNNSSMNVATALSIAVYKITEDYYTQK